MGVFDFCVKVMQPALLPGADALAAPKPGQDGENEGRGVRANHADVHGDQLGHREVRVRLRRRRGRDYIAPFEPVLAK
jgi:hypothetical protein